MKKISSLINDLLAKKNLRIVRGGISDYGIPPNNLQKKNTTIFIKDLKIEVNKTRHAFLLKSYHLLEELLHFTTGKIFFDNDERTFITVLDITVEVQTSEDILILHEIFVKGIYNLQTPESSVLIDIGMNVGFTSLYFALNKQVSKIYAFEPFEPTYLQGLNNISLNKIGSKISAVNYGLGDIEKKIEVDYIPSLRGSMGINGIPFYLANSIDTQSKEVIHIRPAHKVFEEIKSQNPPGTNFIFKIDCEGSEYAILETLAAADMLKDIRVLLIEWHLKGPAELLSMLTKADFTTLSFTPFHKETGMLYAIRH